MTASTQSYSRRALLKGLALGGVTVALLPTVAFAESLPGAAGGEAVDTLLDELTPVADLVANWLHSVSSEQLVVAWSAATEQQRAIVSFASTALGKKYRYATSGPDSYDCSGLTSAAWARVGVTIPHSSSAQRRALVERAGAPQPGDIFWRPGHVGLALGVGDSAIHASGSRVGVVGCDNFKWKKCLALPTSQSA